MKVYRKIIPKTLDKVNRVNPVKKSQSNQDLLDELFTHEYSSEENDEDKLIYNSRGRLVQKIKNKKNLKERKK